MKRLFLIAIILTTIVATAQNEKKTNKRNAFRKDLSNEQLANLKTKKMTLNLDLSNKQEDAIYLIHLDLVKKHRSKAKTSKVDRKKMSSEEKYQRILKRLEDKIEIKRRFAVVLTEKQMEKLELHRMKHKRKNTRKRMQRKRKNRA